MSDDEKLKEQVLLGKQAEDLINHPLHLHAHLTIKAELVRRNNKTKHNQDDERRELWRKNQTIEWYEQTYARIVRDGAVAEKTLMQRAKSVFRKAS